MLLELIELEIAETITRSTIIIEKCNLPPNNARTAQQSVTLHVAMAAKLLHFSAMK